MAREIKDNNLVQAWRKVYAIKQETLAREAGIHRVSLSHIERGTEPSVTNALKICDALHRLSRPRRYIAVENVFYYSPESKQSANRVREDAADDTKALRDGHTW
ncbi:MAG: helix-turn-helix domain-containing protein [Actinomycetota bacterium]|nr:helix-turn-helix domain-containing protein [Actinomycetota bacterium]